MSVSNPIVKPDSVPGQQDINGDSFPLILRCEETDGSLPSLLEWIAAQRAELERMSDRHGAILFRNFPLTTAEDFDQFVTAFGYENFPYRESLSNAVRVNRTERVFTANEAPPDVRICLHHEMAQTPVFPGKLFFFCEKAAESGGATPLCRSDVLFDRLLAETPEFAADCESKGLKYSNVMPAENDPESGMGRSWQSTFRAESQADAEAQMQRLGYTWEWLPDGCLRATTPRLPAVRALTSGRRSFFNQLIAAFQGWKDKRNDPSKAITFGDGTPLDTDAVHRAIEIAEELSFDVPWQAGDVALVDNFVTMHGRRTFTGTRRVLASLAMRHNA